jgi:hypothetical protein
MTDQKYNGWTNYATWRINLELFDGMDIEDEFNVDNEPDFDATMICLHTFAEVLKERAEEVIFLDSHIGGKTPSSLMEDYARAFISDVNWYEIAKHKIDDYALDKQN